VIRYRRRRGRVLVVVVVTVFVNPGTALIRGDSTRVDRREHLPRAEGSSHTHTHTRSFRKVSCTFGAVARRSPRTCLASRINVWTTNGLQTYVWWCMMYGDYQQIGSCSRKALLAFRRRRTTNKTSRKFLHCIYFHLFVGA